MTFLLGSDPELMLVNKDGRLKSAIGVINGTKEYPMQIAHGVVSWDNVNAEFGITPAVDENDWVDRHRKCLLELSEIVKPLKLSVKASADFPDSELEHPFARIFGCEPDFNPYTLMVNTVPEDAASKPLRTAGGHIHLGSDSVGNEMDKQIGVVKAMDIFLGLTSLILDKDPTSHRRRILYGKAGAHRPKPYGVEYRALGNFWLSSPNLTRLMYKLTRDCLAAFLNAHTDGINELAVVSTINNGNVIKAERALSGIVIPLLEKDTRKLLAESISIPHNDNIEKAWL